MGQKAFIILLVVFVWLLGCAGGAQKSANMEFGVEVAERGLWKEAMYRWQQVLKINPGNPAAHNNLAVAYEEAGQYDLAEAHYKKALELDHNNKWIQDNYREFQEFYKSYQQEGEETENEEDTGNKE